VLDRNFAKMLFCLAKIPQLGCCTLCFAIRGDLKLRFPVGYVCARTAITGLFHCSSDDMILICNRFVCTIISSTCGSTSRVSLSIWALFIAWNVARLKVKTPRQPKFKNPGDRRKFYAGLPQTQFIRCTPGKNCT
jgi:hypothetical protein